MKTKLLRMARRLWAYDIAPRELNRSNQLKWARSVVRLGDHWLLVRSVGRKTPAEMAQMN